MVSYEGIFWVLFFVKDFLGLLSVAKFFFWVVQKYHIQNIFEHAALLTFKTLTFYYLCNAFF